MFSKKPDESGPSASDAAPAMPRSPAARDAAPAMPRSPAARDAAPAMPARKPVMRPEVVRGARDYSLGGSTSRDEHAYRGYSGEGKKLIVGREIALSGQISSCEKLVVEGRVEANISQCREIEVAESGTFKGEAEIDVAEISGSFEGTLVARELLMVRAQGHVTGTVRYGRLEVERGGQINGDVQVYTATASNDAADADGE